MQHLEGSGMPVLYIGRTVFKVKAIQQLPTSSSSSSRHFPSIICCRRRYYLLRNYYGVHNFLFRLASTLCGFLILSLSVLLKRVKQSSPATPPLNGVGILCSLTSTLTLTLTLTLTAYRLHNLFSGEAETPFLHQINTLQLFFFMEVVRSWSTQHLAF